MLFLYYKLFYYFTNTVCILLVFEMCILLIFGIATILTFHHNSVATVKLLKQPQADVISNGSTVSASNFPARNTSNGASAHVIQRVVDQPEDTEVLVGAQSAVLQCRFEEAVGTPSWTRDGLLLLRNYSSYSGPRFSIITNSSALPSNLYCILYYHYCCLKLTRLF